MIDHDLSQQLHSLAATIDEPLDLAALHRRISVQNRRRVAARAGVAGVGVAAVVGGLFVVTNERSAPAQSGVASAPVAPSAAPGGSSPAIDEPAALPDCATVLAGLPPTGPTVETGVPAGVTAAKAASADELGERGFKGIVTITAVDGPQLSFTVDEPDIALPSSGLGTLDDATEWVDGGTPLTAAPTLSVGQQLGLATRHDSDGVDRVIIVDVSAVDEAAKPEPKTEPTDEGAPLSDEQRAKIADVGSANSLPGDSLPSDAIEKSLATIDAADATTLTVTLVDRPGPATTMTIDVAATQFYAGNTVCMPGILAAGDEVGVAYHLDEAGNLVADSVLLMP